jgi:hypothetical protein
MQAMAPKAAVASTADFQRVSVVICSLIGLGAFCRCALPAISPQASDPVNEMQGVLVGFGCFDRFFLGKLPVLCEKKLNWP